MALEADAISTMMMAHDANLLKDDVDATLQPFLRINVQVVYLLHHFLQLLQRHLVQDASQLPIQLLQTRHLPASHPLLSLGPFLCSDSRQSWVSKQECLGINADQMPFLLANQQKILK